MTTPCWHCGDNVPPEREGVQFCSEAHAAEWWGERHDPLSREETVASLRALYGVGTAERYVPRLPAPDWSWAP